MVRFVGERMDFKIIWSDAAIGDLQSICSYLARFNADAAERIGSGILNHVQILADFPYIGPTYPPGAKGPLRVIVFPPYRIFYDVAANSRAVEILHLRHGSRDEPNLNDL